MMSLFLIPQSASTFARGDCTFNVCEMRFMTSSLEVPRRGSHVHDALGHLSRGFACHLFACICGSTRCYRHVRHFHHQVKKTLTPFINVAAALSLDKEKLSFGAEPQFKTQQTWKTRTSDSHVLVVYDKAFPSAGEENPYHTNEITYWVQIHTCWYFATRTSHHQVKKTLTIPVESYEGVGQPFSSRTLLHTRLPFGRGPTQGTFRRELTAEGLLPSMFFPGVVYEYP